MRMRQHQYVRKGRNRANLSRRIIGLDNANILRKVLRKHLIASVDPAHLTRQCCQHLNDGLTNMARAEHPDVPWHKIKRQHELRARVQHPLNHIPPAMLLNHLQLHEVGAVLLMHR